MKIKLILSIPFVFWASQGFYQRQTLKDILWTGGYLFIFVVVLCIIDYLPEGPLYAAIWHNINGINWGHIW